MRFKEKEYIVDFPVFEYEVKVIITSDVNKSRKLKDKLIGHSMDGECSACHSYDPLYSGAWIFLPNNHDVSLIVHESFHCIRRMFEWASVRMENETWAFHLGYLSNKIHKLYKTNKIGKS